MYRKLALVFALLLSVAAAAHAAATDDVRLQFHGSRAPYTVGVLCGGQPVRVTVKLLCGDVNPTVSYRKVTVDPGEEVTIADRSPDSCHYFIVGAWYLWTPRDARGKVDRSR